MDSKNKSGGQPLPALAHIAALLTGSSTAGQYAI